MAPAPPAHLLQRRERRQARDRSSLRHRIHTYAYAAVAFALFALGAVFSGFAIFERQSEISKIWLAGPTTIAVALVLCGKVIIDRRPRYRPPTDEENADNNNNNPDHNHYDEEGHEETLGIVQNTVGWGHHQTYVKELDPSNFMDTHSTYIQIAQMKTPADLVIENFYITDPRLTKPVHQQFDPTGLENQIWNLRPYTTSSAYYQSSATAGTPCPLSPYQSITGASSWTFTQLESKSSSSESPSSPSKTRKKSSSKSTSEPVSPAKFKSTQAKKDEIKEAMNEVDRKVSTGPEPDQKWFVTRRQFQISHAPPKIIIDQYEKEAAAIGNGSVTIDMEPDACSTNATKAADRKDGGTDFDIGNKKGTVSASSADGHAALEAKTNNTDLSTIESNNNQSGETELRKSELYQGETFLVNDKSFLI